MGENNKEPAIDYKIGIIGPTRVGKTSIITALLEQGQELLAGDAVSIEGVGITEKRINQYLDELRGSLMADEFNPGGLRGNNRKYEFKVQISVGNSKLTWAILDYPGDWLDKGKCPSEKDWEYCQAWIKESIVLLVPIDAAVVMESTTTKERQEANKTLQIAQAEQIARKWAKGRIEKNEPGLLILVPVKCETYFSDNGGRNDQSEDLFNHIKECYQPLLKAVRQEINGAEKNGAKNKPEILIQYHPVDTIGCVEIKSAEWRRENEPGDWVFEAYYLVRPPRERCPKGADGLLIAICRQITNLEKNKKRGTLSRFWRWLTQEDKHLNQAIEKLQAKPFERRVKELQIGG